MTRATLILILACAMAPSVSFADAIRARVTVGTQKASGYDLLGRKADKISMTPIGVGGLISMGISSIKSLEIDRPKTLNEATFLMAHGKTDEAVGKLRQMARDLNPYTDVPNNNAVDLICDAVDLLRSAERWTEAMELLGNVTNPAAGSNAARVSLLRAYCLTATGKTLQAEAEIKKTKMPQRGEALYPVAKIVESRVQLTVSNINQALDLIAQAIVDTPIESEYYPECLFLAGSCYYALVGQTAAAAAPPAGPAGKSDSDRIMSESGGPRAAATETFSLLVQMSPESRWAQVARERLKQIGAEAPPTPPAPGAPPPAGDAAAAAPPAAGGAMMEDSGAATTNAPARPQEQSKEQQ